MQTGAHLNSNWRTKVYNIQYNEVYPTKGFALLLKYIITKPFRVQQMHQLWVVKCNRCINRVQQMRTNYTYYT